MSTSNKIRPAKQTLNVNISSTIDMVATRATQMQRRMMVTIPVIFLASGDLNPGNVAMPDFLDDDVNAGIAVLALRSEF